MMLRGFATTWTVALFTCTIATTSPPARAQPPPAPPPVTPGSEAAGRIEGHARDSNGAPIAKVRVTAKNRSTHIEESAITDDDGAFSLTLAPGSYDVTALKPDGNGAEIENVAVVAGSATPTDVAFVPKKTKQPANEPAEVSPEPATPPSTTPPPGSPPPPLETPPAPGLPPLEVEQKHLDTTKNGEPVPDESTLTPDEDKNTPSLNIYGFAMLDTGYEFGRSDPDWFDVARTTKLPATSAEFGDNGHWFAGVRQSRFGVKTNLPTGMWLGDMKTIFEFDMFGVGADAGQTTIRLRHAWGELWQFGAGQTWSPFMDPDVFPNSVEYWGPPGMVFFRNVQLRWTPYQDDNLDIAFAAERPGATADTGTYKDRIELTTVTPRFPLPDFSGHLRVMGDWGHVQLGGIIRYIAWDDNNTGGQVDLSGSAVGWGTTASTNIKVWKDTIRLQGTIGQGIENYMNDATVDIGIKDNSSDVHRPLLGSPLFMWSAVAFYDRTWSEQITSSIGYSVISIANSDGQAPDAFQSGQYALANILFKPIPDMMFGPEFQWIWRRNKSNGFYANDFRIQASFKYSFDYAVKEKTASQ